MSSQHTTTRRKRSLSWLRWPAFIVLLAIGYGATAYGTPRLAAPRCKTAAVEYLHAHPVAGRDVRGESVAAGPHDIVSVADGAFSVRVAYTVPRDMHASLYSHTCLTLPWRIRLGPRQIVPML